MKLSYIPTDILTHITDLHSNLHTSIYYMEIPFICINKSDNITKII